MVKQQTLGETIPTPRWSSVPALAVWPLTPWSRLRIFHLIMDDVHNIEGSPEDLGKATGIDADKLTFATRYDTATTKQFAQDDLQSTLEALSPFGVRSNNLRTFARELIRLKPAAPTMLLATR